MAKHYSVRCRGCIHADAIPEELKGLRRWVVWRAVPNIDPQKKARKVPINPKTGKPASATNPSTWASFEVAQEALRRAPQTYVGLMFALDPEDGYVIVDLYKCRNPNNNTLNAQAQAILKLLNSYTEASPSGTGIHAIVKAKKPGDRCRHDKIEMYDHARSSP